MPPNPQSGSLEKWATEELWIFFFSPTWQFFCPICRIHCEHFFLCFSADVTLGEEARWHWLIGKCCCFKKGLSSLLHPSTQGSSWQAGWCWDWGGAQAAVSGLGVHECKSLCVCVCVCVCVECKCGAVAVWCSQAAPDVPQQSTVQKLFISPSMAAAELLAVWEQSRFTPARTCTYAFIQYMTRVSPAETQAYTYLFIDPCLHTQTLAPGSPFTACSTRRQAVLRGCAEVMFLLPAAQTLLVIRAEELDKAVHKLPFL